MPSQMSQAKAAIIKEQKLKEQLREQMVAAADDSKRQLIGFTEQHALTRSQVARQEARKHQASLAHPPILWGKTNTSICHDVHSHVNMSCCWPSL